MAKRIHLRVPHSLPQDEAHERVQALGDYFKNKYSVNVVWDGRTVRLDGRYMVVHFEGVARVEPNAVDLDGKDPGFLLRGQALRYLERKLRAYLDPGTPIEQLPRR